MTKGGYRGFASKAAYEAHYSDERNYADEIPAMQAYTRESMLAAHADLTDTEIAIAVRLSTAMLALSEARGVAVQYGQDARAAEMRRLLLGIIDIYNDVIHA